MPATPEHNIESIIIAILAGQTTPIVAEHYESTLAAATNAQRVTVQCMPKSPLANARKSTLPAKVWEAQVTVQIQVPLTVTPAELSAICAAVDTAFESAAPAGAVTVAQGLFPNGFEIEASLGGDRSAVGDDVRTPTRIYRVIFRL